MATKDEQQAYIFKRGYKSSMRLNYNHWLMRIICGYLIHPEIQYNKDGVCIADIGTGTGYHIHCTISGIWPLEVAAEIPSAKVDGFDISSDQYPLEQSLPSNVRFYVHDAFKPFPEEHRGKYDIVHVRFLSTLINNENASTIVGNVEALLRPGGYLQWFEPASLEYAARSLDASVSTIHTSRMAEHGRKPKPDASFDWIIQLGSKFEELGLRLKAHDRLLLPERYRLAWQQSSLAAVEDLAENASADQAKQIRQWLDGLLAEYKQGVWLEVPLMCTVGEKPV